MLLSSLHTGFSFLSYFNFQRFCPVLWRFLSIKGSPLFLLHGCVAFLFPSPRIYTSCSLRGPPITMCLYQSLFFMCEPFLHVCSLSCRLTCTSGGPKCWLEQSCSLWVPWYMTWLDCFIRNPHCQCLYIFSSLFSVQISPDSSTVQPGG